MATLTAYSAFNYRNITELGESITKTTHTSTKMVAVDGDTGVTYTLTGQNFTYVGGADFDLSGGTLSKVEAKLGSGASYFTSSNLAYNLNNDYYDSGYTLGGYSSGSTTLYGMAAEVAVWFKGNDTLAGSSSADRIAGFNGNDKITGNAGNDRLEGWAGNDTLNGGLGKDTLVGGTGSGNDVFVFSSALSTSNVDTILQFGTGTGTSNNDRIYLDDNFFTRLGQVASTTQLSLSQFAANTAGVASDATDRIIYETDTGKLFYDQDGSGSASKILFAVVGTDTHPVLTNKDFYIIP